MHNKIAVFGIGQMGLAIVWALDKLGYSVVVIDQDTKKLQSIKQQFPNIERYHDLHNFITDYKRKNINVKAAISALPYHQNLILAQFCVDNQISYCDLGGDVETTNSIHNVTRNSDKNIKVFTDLGLAPGLVNILAQQICYKYGMPDELELMVGGLPKYPINLLKYSVSWSLDGLINEYFNNCVIINNGKKRLVSGFSGYEKIIFPHNYDKLECFYTSGGLSHTAEFALKNGIKECCYKTLRYVGHHEKIYFLRLSGLNNDQIKEVIKKSCPPTPLDQVILYIQAKKGNTVHQFQQYFSATPSFTAMQMCTAFPIAVVASLMVDFSDCFPNKICQYEDIPFKFFIERLNKLIIGQPICM